MTRLRTAAAVGAAAAAALAAGTAGAAPETPAGLTPGGIQMATVHQSVGSAAVAISVGGARSSAVAVAQSGGAGSIHVQAVATSPPGPTLSVRLPARRVKALLAGRAPLLEVTADPSATVEVAVVLRWRPRAGGTGRVVLLRRDLALEARGSRRLRLGASERGLDRLPDAGRITILITGRAVAGVAVGLQLTA